jgi:hypothetical protein
MKYTDFNQELPKLQLGQVVNQSNNAFDIQWRLLHGKDVIDEGVARTIRVGLDEIEVDAEGYTENVKLSGNKMYIVKTGFVPDTTGLGAIPRK